MLCAKQGKNHLNFSCNCVKLIKDKLFTPNVYLWTKTINQSFVIIEFFLSKAAFGRNFFSGFVFRIQGYLQKHTGW